MRRCRRSLNLSSRHRKRSTVEATLATKYYRRNEPWQAAVRPATCGTPSRHFRKYDSEPREAVPEILGNRAAWLRQVNYRGELRFPEPPFCGNHKRKSGLRRTAWDDT